HVSGSAGADFVVEFSATDFLERFDCFQHGHAIARAEVVYPHRLCSMRFAKKIDSKCMRVCDVAHMNEIANARTIAGVVVVAEDCHLAQLTYCRLRDSRNKILWLANGNLTNFDGRMCSHGIEVSKKNAFCLGGACEFCDHLLTHLLCEAVRRFRWFRGCLFGYRN